MNINKIIYIYYCSSCGKKENKNLRQPFSGIDFSGIKHKSDHVYEGFCCKEVKKQFNKYRQETTIPSIAELDQSMNYCQYFVRDKGNEGFYKRDGFSYKVNGLWDYKTIPTDFIESFKKYFGHSEYFNIHERYKESIKDRLDKKYYLIEE